MILKAWGRRGSSPFDHLAKSLTASLMTKIGLSRSYFTRVQHQRKHGRIGDRTLNCLCKHVFRCDLLLFILFLFFFFSPFAVSQAGMRPPHGWAHHERVVASCRPGLPPAAGGLPPPPAASAVACPAEVAACRGALPLQGQPDLLQG